MGLRQTLGRFAAAALCAGGLGCHTTKKVSLDIRESLFTATPQPASSLGCMWKKQIAHLPDPSRNGVMSPGIVGVMNLYAADGLPTKADGDLQIMAYDETTRVAGQPAAAAEGWHFDAVTLKTKLATKDERGMDCYALFLPWPKNWTDVTKVRMQAKYVPKAAGPQLSSNDPPVTFEFSPAGGGSGIPGNAQAKNAPAEMRGIPDLKKLLQQPMSAPITGSEVVNAAATIPAAVKPVVIPAAVSLPVLPANAPLMIPADAAPVPLPVPPPPPPRMAPQPISTPVMPVSVAKPDTTIVTVGEGLPDLVIPAAK